MSTPDTATIMFTDVVNSTTLAAVLSACLAAGVAQAYDGPDPDPADRVFTINNGCDRDVWLAMVSNGRVRGWQHMPPGLTVAFQSTEVFGVHARFANGGYRAPGGLYEWLPVRMDDPIDYIAPPNGPGLVGSPGHVDWRNSHYVNMPDLDRITVCRTRLD